MEWHALWSGLGWPLVRLCLFICLGLFVANLIEALNWTRAVAKLAQPLVRLARLQDITGASFSMAFFSGVAANSMLAEAYEQGRLSHRELLLSNLFNALPTYFLHLPTMFFITVPFLGGAAVLYVGMTLLAAMLRTVGIVVLGRLTMPPLPEGCVVCELEGRTAKSWREALTRSLARLKKRIPRILGITVPIYVLFYFLARYGVLKDVQAFLSAHVGFLSWLSPQALSIVVFQVAAESSGGLAVAGALLEGGTVPVHEVVLALLIGNVLSSPMRAVRHQFPYYAGIFKPRLALQLIVASQSFRAVSLILVTLGYALIAYA